MAKGHGDQAEEQRFEPKSLHLQQTPSFQWFTKLGPWTGSINVIRCKILHPTLNSLRGLGEGGFHVTLTLLRWDHTLRSAGLEEHVLQTSLPRGKHLF